MASGYDGRPLRVSVRLLSPVSFLAAAIEFLRDAYETRHSSFEDPRTHQRSRVFERARRIVSCDHPDYFARPIALRRYRAHMRTCAVPDPETYLDLSILSRIITIIIESRPCASTIVRSAKRERERERATEDKERQASFNEPLNGFRILLRFPVLFLPAKAIIERPEAAG